MALQPSKGDNSGPCPRHINDIRIPVVYYLDPEPCYGCHPELLRAKPDTAAWKAAVEQTRKTWRDYRVS
jgi:hypothetical protein